MSDQKYEVLARETLFQGFFRLDRYQVRHERFEGGWTEPFAREIFSGTQNAAGILPFDPRHDKVVLIEQFRAAAVARGEYPWMLELVSGIVDGGETFETTARREAREEAGCTISELRPILGYYSSPGCMSEYTKLFVGRTTAPENHSLHGLQEENEDIRVHVFDAAQAISLLYNNQLRNSAAVIAMQWFALHHTELRSRWLVSEASTPLI